ncbi:MAG: biotin synthase BioB [Syntrophobacteraceae bacterium]
MNEGAIKEMRRAAETGVPVSEEIALDILRCGPEEIPEIMACASMVRKRRFGTGLLMCSIMNAKSGACTEDCAFCAQSAHHRTHAETFPLAEVAEIEAAYLRATELPVSHFGVVTSGKAVKAKDIRVICEAAKRTNDPRLTWCASLGCLDKELLLALKEAGFKRFHHNLEASESFFPNICTTHSYDLRIETVRAVKEAGLEICSGGILGLGESLEQRVEFAAILAREEVDSIPLNFLIPIPGTRLEGSKVMRPLDMIRTIAMFRMMNPKSELKVCAGRIHLRDLQSMVFYAGATGIMIGDLLTVAGRNPREDLQMIEDLGFKVLC